MRLYFYYLSSYSQKVLMAFYEKGVSFAPEILEPSDVEGWARYRRLYPIAKVPLLELPNGQLLSESSVIIEYLDAHHPDPPRLIPRDLESALRVRQLDRIFDGYVNEPFIRIFRDRRRPEAERDALGVAAARQLLDRAYAYLDGLLCERPFAAGEALSLADCAAAPALAYSGMIHPFDDKPHLSAYFRRLKERPSFARVQAEVAPRLARLPGA